MKKRYDYQWNCPFNQLIKKYPLMKNHIEKVKSEANNTDTMKVLIRKNKRCGYELLDVVQHSIEDRTAYLSEITNIYLGWVSDMRPLSYIYDKILDPSALTYEDNSIDDLNRARHALAYRVNVNIKRNRKNQWRYCVGAFMYFEDTEQLIKYKLMRMDV